MDLKTKIRTVMDFPEPGIAFRDITTLTGDAEAFRYAIDQIVAHLEPLGVDKIVVLDARGFLVGSPVAYRMDKGIVPIRKAGKLPCATFQASYELEYGKNTLEMHRDAVQPGMRVAVVDDLLATGGTAKAACELVEQAGGSVESLAFIIELAGLKGREKLEGYDIFTLVNY